MAQLLVADHEGTKNVAKSYHRGWRERGGEATVFLIDASVLEPSVRRGRQVL